MALISDFNALERRIFLVGALLVVIGSIVACAGFSLVHGFSFLLGGLLSAVNLALLRHTVTSALMRRAKRSTIRILSGYFFRLLLIPLCLYAVIRLVSVSIIAAIAGFAVFNSGVLVEGVMEAFKSRPR